MQPLCFTRLGGVGSAILIAATIAACSSAATPAAPTAPSPAPAAAAQVAAPPATSPAAAAQPTHPGCPCPSADSPEWRQVLDAARREGELIVLGARNPIFPAMAANFEREFGVKLNYLVGQSGQTQERVLAERDSGRRTATATITGDPTVYGFYKENILAQVKGLPNGARLNPADYVILEESNSHYWPAFTAVYGIYINTNLVLEAEAPQTWRDLLDPKWKGKIVQHYPAVGGGGQAFFEATLHAPGYGEEFHRRYVQQDLLLVRGGGDAAAVVARGERAIGVPGNLFEILQQQGAPIKWIPMQDGMVLSVFVMGAIKDGPHPNAARVFMNWMLSREVQTELARSALGVPSTVGVGGHPFGLTAESITRIGPGRALPSRAEETFRRAQEIYGR